MAQPGFLLGDKQSENEPGHRLNIAKLPEQRFMKFVTMLA